MFVHILPETFTGDSGSIGARLLRASGLVMLGNVSSRLISLFVGIISARLLTEAEFGAFGLLQSTLSMFGVAAGLSLGLAATRYIALYRFSEPARVRAVTRVVLVMGAISAVATTLSMSTFAPWLASYVLGDQLLIRPLRWASVQLLFTAGLGIVGGILSGRERFGLVAILAVLQNVVIVVGCLTLIPAFGLLGAIGAHALGIAVALAFGLRAITDALTGITWYDFWRNVRQEQRVLVDFCLPHTLAGAITLTAWWASLVIVAKQPDGYSELAFFTAADRFRMLLFFVAGFLGTALLPILSGTVRSDAPGQMHGQRGIELGLIGTGILVLPLTTLLAFGGPQIMSLFGRTYEMNWTVLLPVIAWGGVGAIGSTVGTALLAHGKQWFLFLQHATYGATVLGLTYLLRELGGTGLALAHLGAVLLLLAWSYPVVKNLGVLTPRTCRTLVGITAAVCFICAVSWICPAGWRLIIAGPIALLSGAASGLMLTTAERTRLLDLLRSNDWRAQRIRG